MSSLSSSFLQVLAPEVRAELDVVGVDEELRRFVARARAAWPEVQLDDPTFVTYAGTKLVPGQDLRNTNAEGLYLACACAAGDEQAVALFREHFGGVMQAVYRRLGFQRHGEEVTQRVLRTIFVAEGKSRPAIENYTGRGSLANWLRVLTVREAYRTTRAEQRTRKREVGGIDERIMDRAVNESANPELLHLKRDYRVKFKASFQVAFQRLEHRERNILRYQYLDGLNIDQIGTIYGVSRATVARWRARARARLLSETRKIMRDEHRVPLDEFDNAMRMIESAMDVSLSRLLHRVAAETDESSPSE